MKSSILSQRYSILLLSATFSATALAQTSSTWTHDFETLGNGWGSDFNETVQVLNGTLGTYRYKVVDNHGVFASGTGEEKAGAIITGDPGLDYAYSAVNTTGYDLSATGSSLTMDIWWLTSEISDAVSPASAVNDLAQIGIANASSGILGTMDSLYVAVRELSSETAIGSSQTDYLLNSDGGTVHTFESNKTTYHFTPVNAITAAYHYEVTYANKGSGLMDITVDIDMWEYDSFGDQFDPVDMNYANWSAINVSHGLSSLTDLRPTLGIRVENSAEISTSGTTYDGVVTVPEPSTSFVGLLGLGLCLLRRNR